LNQYTDSRDFVKEEFKSILPGDLNQDKKDNQANQTKQTSKDKEPFPQIHIIPAVYSLHF